MLALPLAFGDSTPAVDPQRSEAELHGAKSAQRESVSGATVPGVTLGRVCLAGTLRLVGRLPAAVTFCFRLAFA